MEGVASSSSMPPTPRRTPDSRRNVSAQLWEIQRPTIERLYSIEGRKLREVMKIMGNSHGFFATCVFPSFLSRLTAIAMFFSKIYEGANLDLGRANTKGESKGGISTEMSGIMRWHL
jgi:hypothetical protein